MLPRGFHRRGLTARVRGAMTLSLLACVAACGSQQVATNSSRHIYDSSSNYHRPASYDPPGPPGDPWGPYIRDASKRFDVPERWIREVMRQESAGRTTATSPVGAMGLMQVMPGTYAELSSRYGFGNDPYHPYDSIMAGAAYIREMYELYGSPAFLAAYNAGPRRLEDYLWGGKGLPAETRNYVARIGPRIVDAHPSHRAPPEVYAAADIPLRIPAGPRRGDTATMLALRDQRRAVDPGVKVATLPPGPVIRMEPIPDGSTSIASAPPPAPVQVASLGNGPVIAMEPIPDGSTRSSGSYAPQGTVVAMAPIPDGSTGPAPSSRFGGNVVAMDPIPDGSTTLRSEAPSTTSRIETAFSRQEILPTPPAFAAGARAAEPASRAKAPRSAPVELAEASAPRRAAPPQTLNLVGTAHAGTLSRPGLSTATAAPGAGNWAVQVGAYASESQARTAANQARSKIPANGVRVAVQPVMQGKTVLYRARVMGLSRDGAQNACEKLRSGRGACMTLSPDSQS